MFFSPYLIFSLFQWTQFFFLSGSSTGKYFDQSLLYKDRRRVLSNWIVCALFKQPMKNDNIMNCAIALKYISTSCILDSLKFVNHIHKHLRVYNIAIFHFYNSSNFAMDFLTFWIYHSTESSMNWSDVTYLPPSQSKLTESILTGDFFKIHISQLK